MGGNSSVFTIVCCNSSSTLRAGDGGLVIYSGRIFLF